MKKALIALVFFICVCFLFILSPQKAFAVNASRVPVHGQLLKSTTSAQVYYAWSYSTLTGTIYNGIGFVPVYSPAYLSIMTKHKPIVTYTQTAITTMDTAGPCPFDAFLPDGVLFSPNSKDIYVVYQGKARPITSMTVFNQYGYSLSNVHWNAGAIAGTDLDSTPMTALPRNLPGTILKVKNSPNYYLLQDKVCYIPTMDILNQCLEIYPIINNVEQSTINSYGSESYNAFLQNGNLVKCGASYYAIGNYYPSGPISLGVFPVGLPSAENPSRYWYLGSEQEIWNMGYLPTQAKTICSSTLTTLKGGNPSWNPSSTMIDYWWTPYGPPS